MRNGMLNSSRHTSHMIAWFETQSQLTVARVKDLLRINEQTGIATRPVLDLWNDSHWQQKQPPTAEHIDHVYRLYGTKLTIDAARKALDESNLNAQDITHVVAVTATNAGSPGFDLIVARELGISESAERALLAGVGCAGGLAALRVARNFIHAAAHRRQNAKVLVIACELCSIHIRAELHAASQTKEVGIGPTLFGDGAAAMVVCNSSVSEEKCRGLYSLVDCGTSIAPNTHMEMSYKVNSLGFLLGLSRKVPLLAAASVPPLFAEMTRANSMAAPSAHDFDWALHPGGLSVIKAVQKSMELSDYALRASYKIYKTRGNTSSVAVLAVLDELRQKEEGSRNVVACSFGPGLTTEMALLERLR